MLSFRENRALLRRRSPRGCHRRAHRARQPPLADQRLERAVDGSGRGRVRDLRPRRVQGLQRQLRPPGRRHPAAAPGRQPGRSGRTRRGGRSGSAATSSASSSPAAAERVDERARGLPARRSASRARASGSAPPRAPWCCRPRPTTPPRRWARPTPACTRPRGPRSSSAAAPDPRRAGADPARARARARRSTCSGVGRLAAEIGRAAGLDAESLDVVDPRGRAPRHRQDRDPRPRPAQARPARRRRVGADADPHHDRRADPRRGAGDGPVAPLVRSQPRALGRRRLPRRARGRGDPARLADHLRLRRLRGDDRGCAPTATRSAPDEAIDELRRCAGTPVRPMAGRACSPTT